MGGGGYRDPLERDPERVLVDVINGVVTVAHASEVYGVVVAVDDDDPPTLDPRATEARRAEIREQRRATASPTPAGPTG